MIHPNSVTRLFQSAVRGIEADMHNAKQRNREHVNVLLNEQKRMAPELWARKLLWSSQPVEIAFEDNKEYLYKWVVTQLGYAVYNVKTAASLSQAKRNRRVMFNIIIK